MCTLDVSAVHVPYTGKLHIPYMCTHVHSLYVYACSLHVYACAFVIRVCMFLTCVRMCIRYTCMHVPYMCTQRGYVFLTGVCSACMCYLHVHAACVCTFGDAVQCRNFYQFLLGWWGNFFLLSVLRFSFFIFILPKVTCLAGRTQVSRFLNHRVLSRYPVLV